MSRPLEGDVEPLMGTQEVAALLEVDPKTVTQWRQRDLGFPDPDLTLSGSPIWREATIRKWAKETGRL